MPCPLLSLKKAVPMQRALKGIVFGSSRSPERFTSFGQAMFWFSIWEERGRRTTGHVNDTWIFTKRKFSKFLLQYHTDLINSYSSRAKEDRNIVFKLVSSSSFFVTLLIWNSRRWLVCMLWVWVFCPWSHHKSILWSSSKISFWMHSLMKILWSVPVLSQILSKLK